MGDEITDLFGNTDEESMYQKALRVPLEDKIKMAIGLIQLYEPSAIRLSDEGYYVCFSGGKDSIVMAKLFEMAGVKYSLNYSNVTIDPPELVQFIKREYPQVELYDQGYKRLGCIGCPMSGNNRRNEFDKYPKYEQMWRRGARAFYDKWKDIPTRRGEERSVKQFESGDQLFDWWMSDENVNDFLQPDCQMYLW